MKVIRFFVRGPGAILMIIALLLGVSWLIIQAHEKQEARERKHQIQRELGKVNPKEPVDPSTAAKEVLLSDRRIVPVNSTKEPEKSQAVGFTQPGFNKVAMPQLVSFYTQVQESPTPTPVPTPPPKRVPRSWLPPGTFIPCMLVNTVESSHINTPVVGEVTHDVWQNGNLIIPWGSIMTAFAASGAVRDRIEVSGTWLITYSDGRHLRVHGVACDRESDPIKQQFGNEDGSAGLQGDIIESNHWANAQAFLALLMTWGSQTGTAIATSALQAEHTTGVTGFPDTTPVLAKYLDQLFNGETGDGRFVRVRASKEFYVFVTDTVFPGERVISGDEPAPESTPSEAPIIEGAIKEKVNEVKKLSF